MQGIIQFFDSLKDFILDGFHFLSDIISDIANLIDMLLSARTYITNCYSFLPTSIISIVALGISLAILFKILGRES